MMTRERFAETNIVRNAKEKIVFTEMHIEDYQKLMVDLTYVRN